MNIITFDVFWGFVCSFFSEGKRQSDSIKLNKNYFNFFSFQSAEMKTSVFLGKNYLCVIILLLSNVVFTNS